MTTSSSCAPGYGGGGGSGSGLLRSLDLFTGVGGITRALHGLAAPVAYCDWEPQARGALSALMADRRLPRAPISHDVRHLDRAWLKSNAASDRVDIIVGGFPCVGFSSMGLQRGFKDSQSQLFSEMLRLADETAAPLLFLENVQDVLHMGMHVIANELAVRRGYELRWCVVSAAMVGAPQKRPRWFCLAVRPGFRHAWSAGSTYEPHPWTASRMPPRGAAIKARSNVAAMSLLGNSVVPDAVRYAFLYLASRMQPPAPPSLSTPRGLQLTPAAAAAAPSGGSRREPQLFRRGRRPADGWPRCGLLAAGGASLPERCARPPPFRPELRLSLLFDPRVHRPTRPPASSLSAPRLTKPVRATRWATPRHGCINPCNYITHRTLRDLPTQVRFEASTRQEHRAGYVNSAFLEWLMGYPAGWTRGGVERDGPYGRVAAAAASSSPSRRPSSSSPSRRPSSSSPSRRPSSSSPSRRPSSSSSVSRSKGGRRR
jgi:C-5 cytosine-specific DNA methylase